MKGHEGVGEVLRSWRRDCSVCPMYLADVSHDPFCQGISVLLSTPHFLTPLSLLPPWDHSVQSSKPTSCQQTPEAPFSCPQSSALIWAWKPQSRSSGPRAGGQAGQNHVGLGQQQLWAPRGQGSSWWPGLALRIQEGGPTCQPRGRASCKKRPKRTAEVEHLHFGDAP